MHNASPHLPDPAADLQPNFRLWIYSPMRQGVFGDGKVRLLETIARTGSLQLAARDLGISYRKAWGDLKKAESCLAKPLILRVRGGKGGGRTTLTPQGDRIIQAFQQFRMTVERHTLTAFNTLKGELNP